MPNNTHFGVVMKMSTSLLLINLFVSYVIWFHFLRFINRKNIKKHSFDGINMQNSIGHVVP